MPRRSIRPYTKSWLFNGTSSLLTNAGIDFSSQSRVIIDGFLRFETQPVNGMIVELSTDNNLINDGFYLYSNNAFLIGGYKDAGGICQWQTSKLALKQWYHFTIVIDRNLPATTGSKIYINGVLSGAILTSTATTGGTFGNYPFYIGSRGGVLLRLPAGSLLKDVRISTKGTTVTAQDISEIYQNAVPSSFTVLDEWLGEDTGATPATAVDTGTFGKNLTITNTLFSKDTPTKPRYAINPITKSVLFDQVSDWITMGNTFDKERTDSFSISADVLYTGNTTGQVIMSKTNSSGNGGYFLSVVNATSGIVRLAVSNTFGTNNVDRKTNIGLPINTWVKVVATYDGSSTAAGIKIYFYGVEQAMTTVSDNLSSSISNAFNTTIGALNASNASCWNGKITNVILHNAALTQQEIIDLTFKNIATHVQAQWDWSNISGATLPALVGGVAGTLSGAVVSTDLPPHFGSRIVAGTRSVANSRTVVT